MNSPHQLQKSKQILILFLILFPFFVNADITIKSIIPDKKRVVLHSDDGFTVGQTVEATSEMDETCNLKITKVNGKHAAADTSQCSFASEFQVGQSLEGGGDGGGGGSSKSSGGLKHYVGGSLYYSLASSIESSAKTATQSITITDTATSALGFGGNYKLEWGKIGGHVGFSYEMARTISERKSGSTTTRYSPAATLSMMIFEFSGSYAIGPVQPYLGFNYNMPTLTGAPTITISGAFGTQIGVAWKITDMFTVDAAYRTINYTVSESNIAYDSSRLWGFMLRGLVYFNLF